MNNRREQCVSESPAKRTGGWRGGVGRGTRAECVARWAATMMWLQETRSARQTAVLLGVRASRLSKWLNAKSKRRWWRNLKRHWARLNRQERQARWRARKLAGLVAARVPRP